MPEGFDPVVLKKAALKQIADMSVDVAGYDAALEAAGVVNAIRIVPRAEDAVDEAGPAGWIPRVESDAQAGKPEGTSDIEGVRKYLLGRPDQHDDFRGLPGPRDGCAEIELQRPSGDWMNCRTRRITQFSGSLPERLHPPKDLGTPISS